MGVSHRLPNRRARVSDLREEAANPAPPWLRNAPVASADTTPPNESPPALRIPDGYELVKSHRPRRKPETSRGRAKVPFTSHEWDLIARYAPRFTYSRLGADAYGKGAKSDPNAATVDPTFAWRTCLFLRGSSIHISLLHTLRSSDVYEENRMLRVRWPRAKTEALQAPALMPRADFDEWVRGYLDAPKPANEQAYTHMFEQLEAFIAGESGERLQINSLRFRHTAFVRWLEPPYRFPPKTVCQWGRTTLRTLTLYWNPEESELAARLNASGVA